MSKRFTLAVWTATMAYNARKIVADVFTVNQIPLLFVWYNDMCVAHDSEGNVLHSNAAAAGMAAAAAAWSERSRTSGSQVIPQAHSLSIAPCLTSSSSTVPTGLVDKETPALTISPCIPVIDETSQPIVLAPLSSAPTSVSIDQNTLSDSTHTSTINESGNKNAIESKNGKNKAEAPTSPLQLQHQLSNCPGGSILDNSKNTESQIQQSICKSGPVMVKPLSMVWNMFPIYSQDNTVH